MTLKTPTTPDTLGDRLIAEFDRRSEWSTPDAFAGWINGLPLERLRLLAFRLGRRSMGNAAKKFTSTGV